MQGNRRVDQFRVRKALIDSPIICRETAMNRIAIALATCLLSANASATIILEASLTNGAETAPTNPTTAAGAPRTSFGSAMFTLHDDMRLSFTGMVVGLDVTGSQTADVNDNLSSGHIHAGPLVTPTTNGPVVWGFLGLPFNDNNPNDFVMTPFSSGTGGTFSGTWNALEGNNTTLAAQLENILSGRAYMNFHTTQFPGGELRGALVTVPAPGTFALMLCSGLLLVGLARQRRRALY
jgi:hypothetical protein